MSTTTKQTEAPEIKAGSLVIEPNYSREGVVLYRTPTRALVTFPLNGPNRDGTTRYVFRSLPVQGWGGALLSSYQNAQVGERRAVNAVLGRFPGIAGQRERWFKAEDAVGTRFARAVKALRRYRRKSSGAWQTQGATMVVTEIVDRLNALLLQLPAGSFSARAVADLRLHASRCLEGLVS